MNRTANKLKRPAIDYRRETQRPIVCLVFVVPFLLFYEIGSILLNDPHGKSGIDQWMHWVLETVGIGQLVILPILTAAILITWHHLTEDTPKVRPQVLLGMTLESLGLGMILFFAGNAFGHLGQMAEYPLQPSVLQIGGSSEQAAGWWSSVVSYVGCGVYEELVFRLILLGGFVAFAKKYWGIDKSGRVVGAIATSLLFAALHYDFFNPAGVEFEVNSFVFRFCASVVFCVLFLFRGFGVAVATHATYDVLTQV